VKNKVKQGKEKIEMMGTVEQALKGTELSPYDLTRGRIVYRYKRDRASV
jgi:translation initiation factor IF-1